MKVKTDVNLQFDGSVELLLLTENQRHCVDCIDIVRIQLQCFLRVAFRLTTQQQKQQQHITNNDISTTNHLVTSTSKQVRFIKKISYIQVKQKQKMEYIGVMSKREQFNLPM